METDFVTGQCEHCGDATTWLDDPAPDLCHMCAIAGRWSTLWGPGRASEYRAMLARLYEMRTRVASIPKRPQVVLMAIDVSGSMYNVAEDVRGGFNQYVASLASDKTLSYRVSLYLFNTAVERMQDAVEPSDVVTLTDENYQPGGGTALFDALGAVITGYEAQEGERPLVVVHTDGQENSSHEWGRTPIAALIEAKKALGWGFVYLGAGIDEWQGIDLGMSSGMTVNTRAGTHGLYEGLRVGTAAYAAGASAQAVTNTVSTFSRRAAEEADNGE